MSEKHEITEALLNKLRWGILDCGRIVLRTHLPALRRRNDVRILALAEPDEGLRGAALGQAPGSVASSDWREVLENRNVESVLSALPTNLHADRLHRETAREGHDGGEVALRVHPQNFRCRI